MESPFYVLDPKIRRNLGSYVFQCLLATLALLVILSMGHALARAVIIAAIASTAFVLFIVPHSRMASPRHVLGGHLVALITGAVASAFGTEVAFLFALQGALAVGASFLLMAATDTEHAPAAGTALGVVTLDFSWDLALFLTASVLALALVHRLARPRLRNLY